VLHSREHLPPGSAERFGAEIDWSWAFVLDRVAERRTRLLVRSRVRLRPGWVSAFYRAVIVPADFLMSRQMLHGIRARAEGTDPGRCDAAAPGPAVGARSSGVGDRWLRVRALVPCRLRW
jgi:hypothetical protein